MKETRLSQNAILNNSKKAPFIEFPVLRKFSFIRHGFSTRLGGVSTGAFASMNLGFNRGDREEAVFENYERICESIGITAKNLVFTDQVHKTVVRRATGEDMGKGMIRERDYAGVDAHITNERGVPLLAFSADCVPVYFVDPVKYAVGLAHSGWKGTVGKIGKVTVERMEEEFLSNPKDIKAVIGPSIGADCYEVSEDVAEAFREAFGEQEINELLIRGDKGRYHLDLWKANYAVLLSAGLRKENIVISNLCTMCNQELFFSHRAMGKDRGSMAAFIQMT